MKYNKIIQGDTLKVLKTLPDEIINCCVTSPPYWGLRDYGTTPQIWDGNKDCKHKWNIRKYSKVTNYNEGFNQRWENSPNKIQKQSEMGKIRNIEEGFCSKCGAWRGSLGLEPTFELYIKHLCDIFDEVNRVLRNDGTCWVNLGDTYNGSKTGNTESRKNPNVVTNSFKKDNINNIPTKSLCLIPQRFAIEMVNRGWILRNTIIWHKPNCMPSSAKDRFTVDFEYLYFFSKSKKYYFEQQLENLGSICTRKRKSAFRQQNENDEDLITTNGRNKRTVWKIPTKPFPDAHFAVFPEALIETPIKAGCPKYVCKKCGKAREKIFETNNPKGISGRAGTPMVSKGIVDTFDGKQIIEPGHSSTVYSSAVYKGLTNCGCNAGFEPGIVLDPFMGAGTTAKVALKQGKKYLGIELKQEYIDMANKRIKAIPLKLFK